ncbi:hypothetical protein Sste5344_008781 [Sporothrix stenoceras]
MSEDELEKNRRDQRVDNRQNHFRDQEYYASKEYDMADIQVPLLSVGNWGGTTLHLRGNIEGYTWAGSDLKYLRMITGRHDLPFYYAEEVEVQRSFLDAFLKGEDRVGWTVKGQVPPVDLILRKGDVGYNNTEAEKVYQRRSELEWPIARTEYTKFHLLPSFQLHNGQLESPLPLTKLTYEALGSMKNPSFFQFTTPPFQQEIEITGHITAHLNVSMSADPTGPTPKDIDLFLTLRYISPAGNEVFYTGSAGDPVPLCKGWIRVSLRKPYAVDVEIWPTNVVVEEGAKIVFEVSSGDTQGCGIFRHEDENDR